LIPYRETIPPGEWAPINIAIKIDGDRDCCGFNNRSYLYADLRDPEKVLHWGETFVRIVMFVEGKPTSSPWFRLLNPESLDGFTLQLRDRA
jgi:hypothetical protein